jgi:hypothetical protein
MFVSGKRNTREEVRRLLDEGRSLSEISRDLGVSKGTVAYHARRLGKAVDERFSRRYDWSEIQRSYDRGLSMRECAAVHGFNVGSWFKAVQRGDIVPRPQRMAMDELLMSGKRRGRAYLKKRILAEGLKQARCERCGNTEWLGRPIPLQLHHVNGDGEDNRIENLQLICANCHSQTDNWGGRKRRGEAGRNG